MKPRLLLLIAVLLECLLVFLVLSPRLSPAPSQPPPADSTQWRDDPTPEAERAIRRQLAWEKWKPHLLWTLLIGNGAVVILCGVRSFRRPASSLS